MNKILMQLKFIKNPLVFYRAIETELNRIAGYPQLRSVELAVTWRCNYNCRYCYADDLMKRDSKDIDVDTIKYIMKQAKDLGCIHVNITGGEPLIRKGLEEVIKAIPKGLIISVVTNGRLLSKEKIDMLKNAGVTSIQWSYGSNYKKDFKLELLRYAQKRGIVICLSILNVKEEEEYNKEAIEIAKKENCFVLYNFPMKYDLDDKFYQENRGLPFVREDNMFWAGKNRCPAGVEKIYITNDGDVMICDRIHNIFGNVHVEALSDIWQRMVLRFNKKDREICLLPYCIKDPDNPKKVILNGEA